MRHVLISEEDAKSVDVLVQEISEQHETIESADFLEVLSVYAQELPRALRMELNSFRLTESDSVCLISGYTVDDGAIGATPDHWKTRVSTRAGFQAEIFFALTASLLGDPIGWATQQDARVMHDIFPIKGHEKEQLGSGSEELLTWHTEDAFHPLRPDYLGLMCLRNPDEVSTTYASVEDIQVPASDAEILRQNRFPIRPDRSHLPQNTGDTRELTEESRELLERSYAWIEELDANPERVAVLFGDGRTPYLRLDPYFMDGVAQDGEAQAALDVMIEEIERSLTGYALKPGEMIFLDNYKAVHGRLPFKARFDGTDRWLKRLNIVRDLRKSRARRTSATARVIH